MSAGFSGAKDDRRLTEVPSPINVCAHHRPRLKSKITHIYHKAQARLSFPHDSKPTTRIRPIMSARSTTTKFILNNSSELLSSGPIACAKWYCSDFLTQKWVPDWGSITDITFLGSAHPSCIHNPTPLRKVHNQSTISRIHTKYNVCTKVILTRLSYLDLTNFLRLELQIRKLLVYPPNDSHSPWLLDPSMLTQEDENMPQSDPSPPLKTHELSHLDHLLQDPIRLPQRYDLSPQKPLKKCSIVTVGRVSTARLLGMCGNHG
jgi:hypothetical protein